MLKPLFHSVIRRATSLLSPSLASYSTTFFLPEVSGNFPCSYGRLRPIYLLSIPPVIAASRRLFSSKAPEHHSRKIFHPCIDGIFKYGFESQIAASYFLNAALDFKGDQEIHSVEFIGKDLRTADPSSPSGHYCIADMMCRTKDGLHFLVVMQNEFREDYHMKYLVENSRMLSSLDLHQPEDAREKRKFKNKLDNTKFWKGINGVYIVIITNKAFDIKRMKMFFFPRSPLWSPSF
jgi:hypothetical protein